MLEALADTGGRGGIRTHGGVKPHSGFRDRPNRPLWHPPVTLFRVYSSCKTSVEQQARCCCSFIACIWNLELVAFVMCRYEAGDVTSVGPDLPEALGKSYP